MAQRKRKIRKQFYFSEEEYQMVKIKMNQYGTENFSVYARKMLIDGYVIKYDYKNIKKLLKELSNLARSINQIAKRANETRNIYYQDILDLQSMYSEVKNLMYQELSKKIG